MKKIVCILIDFCFLLITAFSQKPPVLTYETHALQAGLNNNMILCKYVDPGHEGYNALWDFSFLEAISDFTGTISGNTRLKVTDAFNQANTALAEFGNRFYLKVTPDNIEQYGYSTHNNTVIVTYKKPFIKMVFPFTMGDRYSGDYYGSMKMGNCEFPLAGNYEVTADGSGKLILPGNATIDNALRVKTVKSYEMEVSGTTHFINITTFRWYGCYNRYPLLVLTAIKTSVGYSVTYSYQAAYNNVINSPVADVEPDKYSTSIRAYPNPAHERMTIEYKLVSPGKVKIEIYNNTGRMIRTLLDDYMDTGIYRFPFFPGKEGLSPGIYIIKADLNQTVVTEEIAIIK
ncbi:MAG: T9SS type A sorting domain-containing protein [Bacteroidales bacterium]|nr:T9SS type A sorting domain-containing protein [Bacteroidales bacterium]